MTPASSPGTREPTPHADAFHGPRVPAPRAQDVPGRARLNAILATLAFVAIADTVSTGLRYVASGPTHVMWLRLALGAAMGAGLSAWCLVRSRDSRSGAPHRFHAGAVEAGSSAHAARIRTPRWLARWLRPARWILLAALAVVAAITVVDQWNTLEHAVAEFRHLRWRWLRAAIYAEALSIVAVSWVWVLVLRAGGARIGLGSMLKLVLAGNAITVTLPGGAAWAATFSFTQLRRHGVPRHHVLRMMLMGSMLSGSTLVVLLSVGVDLAGDVGPAAPFRPLVIAGVALLSGLALAGVVVGVRWRDAIRRRLGDWMSRRGALVTAAAGQPESGATGKLAAGFAAAMLNWVMDCGCLVAAILAVAGHVPWPGLLVAYAVGQVAQNVPLTPGGVGVVEGALSVLLVAYGMHASTALAAVLIYRIISFWVLVPLGWTTAGSLLMLQRRERRRAHTATSRPGVIASRSGGVQA